MRGVVITSPEISSGKTPPTHPKLGDKFPPPHTHTLSPPPESVKRFFALAREKVNFFSRFNARNNQNSEMASKSGLASNVCGTPFRRSIVLCSAVSEIFWKL
jgi:hypothetical protein